MAPQIVRTAYDGEVIYSPFTGVGADTLDDTSTDSSILFVHYGSAGEYAHVSDRVRESFLRAGVEQRPEDLSPAELGASLAIPGAIVLEVDAGWNGINTYGFAPPRAD